MKTLDEAIEIFEKVVKHDYVWFDEKTALMTIETLTDTLHYLKELRDMTDIPMEYFESGGTLQNFADTSQITCPKCHSEFVILPESNNALTWDELKQMVGKPVWLEDSNQQGEWVLMSGMEDDELYFVYRTCNEYKIYRKEQGTLWKAYRKEQS